MSGKQDMFFSVDDESSPRKLMEDFEKVEDNDSEWLFPRASHYLATTVRSGELRPLSPTLKIHSPQSEFPGIAILREGFDDMREWKNTIEFVGFFARMHGKMFNSRHHWDMRTKFLDVRLQCMDKIIEDPCEVNRKPEGGFFVCIPVAVQKAMQEDKRKMKLACDIEGKDCITRKPRKDHEIYTDGDSDFEKQGCAKKELRDTIKEKSNLCKKQNVAKNERGITIQGEYNVDVHNCAIDKDRVCTVENIATAKCRVEFSSARASLSDKRIVSKGNRKNIDVFSNNETDKCIDDYSSIKKDASSPSSSEVNLSMLRRDRRLEKENIYEKVEGSTEDEKLKRENLQKGLNSEHRRESESQCGSPERNAGFEHSSASDEIEADSMRDLIVTGKSIQVESSFTAELGNETKEPSFNLNDVETENFKMRGISSKSETWSRNVEEELVLEDINDKDFVAGLFLPCSSKLKHTGFENDPSQAATKTSSKAEKSTGIMCGKLVNQHTIEPPKQGRNLSRLARLRKRIANLFSCFRKNQVMPIEIAVNTGQI